MGKFKRFVLAAVLMALVALVVAAPASALSSSTKQVDPGVTVRTVWDEAQVACYKLPDGINHTGYIHMELKFKPDWADFDIYLLNSNFQTLSEEMGYMAMFAGKEVIDYRVPRIYNQTIEPGDPYSEDDDYMVGDAFYVVVVAFNETAKFQIKGYYPQIDLSAGAPSTTNQWNYYIQGYRKPSSSKDWIQLKGAQYGGPYDFKPTSVGEGQAWLQWPANIVNKTVDYDPVAAPSPANMEQYMYAGSDWYTVFENYGDANWTPPQQTAPTTWYGLKDTFAVVADGVEPATAPLRTLHYTPSLYLIASDALSGGTAEPKLGKNKMGFKVTLAWPENLRISSAPSKVKAGKKATIKGTFALNRAWQASASIKVQKQRTDGTWKTVKTVTTDANGSWVAKVKVSATTYWRATATGDPATGLATEISSGKKIKATK